MNDTAQPIPQDIDIERALLGGLLRDSSRLEMVRSIVQPAARNNHDENLFYEQAHRIIFGAIQRLHQDGRVADPVSLQSYLRDAGQLDLVGGALYLSELLETPPGASVEQYARLLLEKRDARRQLRILDQVRQRIMDGESCTDLYRELAESQAQPGMTLSNQAPALDAFLTTPRPALRYWIEGFLPDQGKMTLSAVAKGFKTTLLIELGLCAAAGECEYLNFRFTEQARVLFAQPELSDGLLAERLRWIKQTAPTWLNTQATAENFHILETGAGRLSLWPEHPRCAQSRSELEKALADHQINILLVDSLYMTFAGMDENSADQMTLALDYLGGLANHFGVAVILSHHFNKSGTAARGSSVYQGWGETDLSISTVEKDPSVVHVDALLRCAFPKGFPAHWRKPTQETAWFELLPEGWQAEAKGRKSSFNSKVVSVALQAAGRNLRWGELKDAVMDATNCSERKAADLISTAVADNLIFKAVGFYSPVAIDAQLTMNRKEELHKCSLHNLQSCSGEPSRTTANCTPP